ncbi:MAG: KH domain-containing protein [Desulfovibrio sp.]|nr:KH domain-containing protein [Mailhella sp.]MBQ3893017.1 KH domain-containing protein [Mailhella sp.]
MLQKELVEYIARSLVDNPDQVQVREQEGEQGTVLQLSVLQEDIGKIIGRQGRTARAIRTLIGAVSAKSKKRAFLEIVE